MGAAAASSSASSSPPVTCSELHRWVGDVTGALEDRPFAWHVDPRAETPAVLAFDCGRETGVALVSPMGKLLLSFLVLGGNRIEQDLTTGIDKAIEAAKQRTNAHELLLVVEDVFVLRGKRANPLTMARLAYYVGAVLAAGARAGVPCMRVYPTTWQSRLLGKIRRDQGKAMSLRVARARFGPTITTDHQADAALLALYVRGGR